MNSNILKSSATKEYNTTILSSLKDIIHFETNERIYFLHKSLHVKYEGYFIITSIRIVWIAIDNKSIPVNSIMWSTVTDIKYSKQDDPKGRVAINVGVMIPTSTNSGVFELIGYDKDLCRQNLESLKLIIGSIRRNDFLMIEPYLIPKIELSTPSTSSSLNELDKKYILSHNEFLNKQYQDLVIKSAILDDADFWLTYSSTISQHLNQASTSREQMRGTLPDTYNNIISIHENEWTSLSEAKKQKIFALFPAVQQAYMNKDMLNVSEEDFWRRYYYSFHVNSDFIDDIFVRGTISENKDNRNGNGLQKTFQQLKSKISTENDLVNLTDDYFQPSVPQDRLNDGDIDTTKDSKIRKAETVKVLTGGWNAYNKQSQLVINTVGDSMDSVKRSRTSKDTLDELNIIDETKQYIPLQYHSVVPIAIDSSISVKVEHPGKILSAQELLSSIEDVLPSSSIFSKFHISDIQSLSRLSKKSNSTLKDYSLDINYCEIYDGSELSDTFKQEMTEVFVSVTERIKHFYVLLNRESNNNMNKLYSLVEDLKRYAEKLRNKKELIQSKNQEIEISESIHSAIWIISDIQNLINRVELLWMKYQET